MKNSFILHIDQYAPIQALSLEQKGKLLDAFFSYNMGEEVSFDDPVLGMAFAFFKKSFELNSEKYERKCRKNKENIEHRYAKPTNVYDGSENLRTNTNATDTDTDTDTDFKKKTLTSFESSSSPCGEDQPAPQPDGEKEPLEPEGKNAPPCPYREIVALYHEALPEHPAVKVLNASRQKTMRARWGDVGKRLRGMNQPCGSADRLTWLRRFFAKASQSPFLTGQVHQRDKPPFRADFDFLFTPKGFTGVVEGKYDNREAA